MPKKNTVAVSDVTRVAIQPSLPRASKRPARRSELMSLEALNARGEILPDQISRGEMPLGAGGLTPLTKALKSMPEVTAQLPRLSQAAKSFMDEFGRLYQEENSTSYYGFLSREKVSRIVQQIKPDAKTLNEVQEYTTAAVSPVEEKWESKPWTEGVELAHKAIIELDEGLRVGASMLPKIRKLL